MKIRTIGIYITLVISALNGCANVGHEDKISYINPETLEIFYKLEKCAKESENHMLSKYYVYKAEYSHSDILVNCKLI